MRTLYLQLLVDELLGGPSIAAVLAAVGAITKPFEMASY